MGLTDDEIPKPWLKTLDSVRDISIEYEDISTYHFVKRRAENEANDPSMIVPKGKTITYEELFDSIRRLGAAFTKLGVKKGTRVALMLPNTPHYIIAHYALLGLGAIVVQTNPLYTARELKHILDDSEAVGILTWTMFQSKVDKVMEDSTLEWAIYGNAKDYLSPIIKILGTLLGKFKDHPKMKIGSNNYEYLSLLADSNPNDFTEAEIDIANDVALLQYTGGTTGLSKGAMLTHKNISYNAQQARSAIFMVPEKTGSILTALPVFHSFGLTACMGLSFQLGVPMVLVAKFEPGEALELIEKHKITFFPGVPTMMIALLNHPTATTRDLSSLIAVISGGAALPVEVAKQFKEVTGGDLVEGYGLSETSPLVTINPIGNEKVPPQMGSIGLPAADTLIKIVDTEDPLKDIPLGEVGELACKGPQIMKGYWKREKVNKLVLHDGWFTTGDMAYIDDRGFTYIVDRKKDMILVSGYNVYPREVEEALFEHPKVLEAAVASAKHPVKGEMVAAWVVLREGETATEEEIIAFCKERIAPYKVPKQVTFRDELPKTMIGKVLRRKLGEEEEKDE